jgi:hypothetical protein
VAKDGDWPPYPCCTGSRRWPLRGVGAEGGDFCETLLIAAALDVDAEERSPQGHHGPSRGGIYSVTVELMDVCELSLPTAPSCGFPTAVRRIVARRSAEIAAGHLGAGIRWQSA